MFLFNLKNLHFFSYKVNFIYVSIYKNERKKICMRLENYILLFLFLFFITKMRFFFVVVVRCLFEKNFIENKYFNNFN